MIFMKPWCRIATECWQVFVFAQFGRPGVVPMIAAGAGLATDPTFVPFGSM
jgi:hypothetical protein